MDLAALTQAIAQLWLSSFTLSGSLSQIKQRLEHAAHGVRQDFAEVADGVSSTVATTLTATTERAMESIDYTVAQAEGVTSSIAQELWRAIAADFALWLQGHPLLSWLLTHPVITLGLAFVAVVLVWGLLQAMAQLAQRAWIVLLNIPLYLVRLAIAALSRLGQWLVAETMSWYRRSRSPQPSPVAQAGLQSAAEPLHDLDRTNAVSLLPFREVLPPHASGDRELIEGLKRLEHLGQQQTQALQTLIRHLEERSNLHSTPD